ncbi:MAG: FapA family protein [Peptococcaceae bacterium]|nr:FapA family protein [Peptococcaceae bacterium]
MSEIIVTASNLEQALTQATQKLNVGVTDLTYDIIAGHEADGSITVKVAIKSESTIDLTTQNGENVQLQDDQAVEPTPGTLAISAGKIIVQKPINSDQHAAITPGENTRVFINGNEIFDTYLVDAEDSVEVRLTDTQPYFDVHVEVTEDKMQAFLTIERGYGQRYALEDAPPAYALTTKAVVAETLPPVIPPISQVTAEITNKKILTFVDDLEIMAQMHLERPIIKLLIAQGKPPVDGIDASVVYSFLDKVANPEEYVQNPHSLKEIFAVQKGEMLAYIKDGIPGTDGVDVYGQLIKAKPPHTAEIAITEGVTLGDGGKKAFASVIGRPILQQVAKKQILRVLPLYEIKGNVDIEVGSVSYKGDLVINGDVLDGFKVYAGGSILIKGSVFDAEIAAEGDVAIGGKVITSTVTAGKSAVAYFDILTQIKAIAASLASLRKAVEIVSEQSTANIEMEHVGKLIYLLIQTKFPTLTTMVEKLKTVSATKIDLLPQGAEAVIYTLEKSFVGLGPTQIGSMRELALLQIQIEGLQNKLQALAKTNAKVSAGYIQNSKISAHGDIVISGLGCIVSELKAKGNITFNSSSSVVRGCTISLDGELKAFKFGSEVDSGSLVILNTPKSTMVAQQVFQGVCVKHGPLKFCFSDAARNVKVSVDQDGQLAVDKLKV